MPKVVKPRRLLRSALDGDTLHLVQYPDSPRDSDYTPTAPNARSKRLVSSRAERLPRVTLERVFPSDPSSCDSSPSSARPESPLSSAEHQSVCVKRHWTVGPGGTERISARGVERRTKWADQTLAVSLLRTNAEGEYLLTDDGLRHYISDKGEPFVDATGQQLCRVSFEDTWVGEEDFDPPIFERSTSPGFSLVSADTPGRPTSPSHQSPAHQTASHARQAPDRMSPARHRQVRAPTTASDISFSNLDPGSIEGLIDHPRSAAANYDQAIDAAITTGLQKGIIATSTGACPSIIGKRKHEPSVRPVQFNSKFTKLPSWTFNFRKVSKAAAFYAHRSGYDVAQPCQRCLDGRGAFQGCVVADGFISGTCTNCAYDGRGGKQCSFRKDTNDPFGHRPAQRLPRREPLTIRSRQKVHKHRHARKDTSLPSPPDSNPPLNEDNDFTNSSDGLRTDNSPSHGTDFLMSGGLGTRSTRDASRAPITPSTNRSKESTSCSAAAKLRKAKRLQKRQDERPSERRRSPSVEHTSTSRKATAIFHPPVDEQRQVDIKLWLAKQPKPTTRTAVYRDRIFAPGEMSAAEFWYIVDACERSNQEILRNQYRWHRYELRQSGQVYDWSFWEHFLWEDCDWFQKTVITIVCPPRPRHQS